MERNIKLEEALKEYLKEYSPSILLVNDAYTLNVSKNDKSISITWPYPLMEVFFDFQEKNEILISESLEFYDNETEEEFIDYLVDIVKRYLTSTTRITTIGTLFKRKELQVMVNHKWQCIYD